MNSSFIITIFLLLACILLSQATEYYLTHYYIKDTNKQFEYFWSRRRRSRRQTTNTMTTSSVVQQNTPAPTTTPPVIPVENTPNIIKKYLSDLKNSDYLNAPQIQNIYNNSIAYGMQLKPISTIDQMNTYLVLLQEKLNSMDSPPLNQLIYFCVSLPYAFKNFFLPDQGIPIPYNKLYAKMPTIFKNSKYYTQIQIMCIQWQQSMLLFIPSTNIGDPRTEVYINVINQYISQINTAITNLLNYSNPVYDILKI